MREENTQMPENVRRMRSNTARTLAVIALSVLLVLLALLATHRLPFFTRMHKDSAARNDSSATVSPRRILYWYDPMHPAYTSNKPGTAPDCGMALVPKYADEAMSTQKIAGTVTLSDEQQRAAGVRTAIVTRENLTRDMRTTAVIVPDESRISHVHVKFSGVIEDVFANASSQYVRKGQTLFTIYSPDLLATEEEYLIARRGRSTLAASPYREAAESGESLLEAARERLALWDISEAQIRQMEQSGKPLVALSIEAPASGYIMDRKAYPHAAVTPDTDLYIISDLSRVWAQVDIFEGDLPYVHAGQRVSFSLSYDPAHAFSGIISQVLPFVDPQTRTVKARVELANPGLHLRPQMFADATIHINYGMNIAVPRDAVLDSGTVQQVYVVQPGGNFVPRTVKLGADLEDRVIVLEGLQQGESIVTSANFLIDSESKMKHEQEQRP